jgi:hypothetical protein
MNVYSSVQRDLHGVEYGWCRMVGKDGRTIEVSLKGDVIYIAQILDGEQIKLLHETIPAPKVVTELKVYKDAEDPAPKNGSTPKGSVVEAPR